MPSPTFFSDGHTPNRNDTKWMILQRILGAVIDGGGGGGAVAAAGTNYEFTGTSPNQVLSIVNLDTGLSNRIDTAGADGVQTVVLSNGV